MDDDPILMDEDPLYSTDEKLEFTLNPDENVDQESLGSRHVTI